MWLEKLKTDMTGRRTLIEEGGEEHEGYSTKIESFEF